MKSAAAEISAMFANWSNGMVLPSDWTRANGTPHIRAIGKALHSGEVFFVRLMSAFGQKRTLGNPPPEGRGFVSG